MSGHKLNFPLFIARRIYRGNAGSKVSEPAIRIATAGVAIGLAVMIVSICVVIGFKHTIRDKVVGFGSHIEVADFMTMASGENYPIAMGDSILRVFKQTQGVTHVQRYAMTQGILKTDSDFLGVLFKGVAEDYDTTFIHRNMVEGSIPKFSDQASSNKILISKLMADKLGIKTGDRIFAYFISKDGVRTRRFTINGIYETNLTQYDKTTCYTDLYTAQHLNGWDEDQMTGAELQVADFNKVDQSADQLREKLKFVLDRNGETYTTKTIKESNAGIFAWLDLLDMNVWIILVLMIAVAGVTMVSGLLIIILERTNMIGLLKALGSCNRQVRHTFLWFATFIMVRGMLIGNVIGLGIVLLQRFTGLVRLDPQVYYVSHVPVEINIPLLLLLNLATLLVGVLILVGPSFLISHIQPSKSMRYE